LSLKQLGWQPFTSPHLCTRCLATFARIDQAQACPGCGRADSPALCSDCQRWQAQGETLLHHRALFTYNAAMKSFIQQYKGQGDYQLHDAFDDQWPHFSRQMLLIPIPSETGHYERRGFDPVLGLFGQLPLSQVLHKHATAKPQAQKSRHERLQTPQTFEVIQSIAPARPVMLLDDLYTTGRTLYHAATALRQAGHRGKIQSFSLIR